MNDRPKQSHTGNPAGHTSPSERRGQAARLLSQMSALDRHECQPQIEIQRQTLRDQATAMGMRLVSITITEEPIPDPGLATMQPRDLDRLETISQDMRHRPERHVDELLRLTTKYPKIPMLRNHLAGACEAAGDDKTAKAIIAQTANEFPTYVFAICNHVMLLLSEGQIDEARAILETGPRGPLFQLTAIDPSRNTFHISEAASHAATVGRYLLATGQREHAKVYLDMLKQIAPHSRQTRHLAKAFESTEDPMAASATRLRRAASKRARGEAAAKPSTSSETPKPHGSTHTTSAERGNERREDPSSKGRTKRRPPTD